MVTFFSLALELSTNIVFIYLLTGRARDKNNFAGLRATSKKDRVKGKKLIGQMQSSTKKPHNAMRRIQSKQLQQKHSKNKQRNINRKVNKNPKEKKFKK